MKKLLTLSLCVLGFILIAAPTAVEYHPVYVNGNLLGNGVVVQGGIIAISLEDFAKAAGAPLTLEPTFTLQGNKLFVREAASEAMKYKEAAAATQLKQIAQPATELKIVQPAASAKVKIAPGQIFRVQHSGLISSNVFMLNGKAYIPLADVQRAFGDGSVAPATINGGTLQPGAAVRLNFTKTPKGILIGL